jgi:hypothetical protein
MHREGLPLVNQVHDSCWCSTDGNEEEIANRMKEIMEGVLPEWLARRTDPPSFLRVDTK